MKHAVAKCPSVHIKFLKTVMPSLLDSGRMVSLVWQDYFNWYITQKLYPVKGQEANAHTLFDLKSGNEGGILLSCYFEVYIMFLALRVSKPPNSPNDLLDQEKITKLPGIMGWIQVKLAYQEFTKNIQIPYL